MGWTKGREVQCGCGWDGGPAETTCRGKMTSLERGWVQFGCPVCNANLTSQTARASFRTEVVPLVPPIPEDSVLWKRYAGKTLMDDDYDTRALNDGLD